MFIFLSVLLASFIITNIYGRLLIRYLKRLHTYASNTAHTGKSLSEEIIHKYNASGVSVKTIEETHLFFMPYYSYTHKEVTISSSVAHGSSLYAIATSLHETFHAVQEEENHWARALRRKWIYHALAASWFILPLCLLLYLVIPEYRELWTLIFYLIYILVCLFHLTTVLSLEWNASRRALQYIQEHDLVPKKDMHKVKTGLTLAWFSYLVSTPFLIFIP